MKVLVVNILCFFRAPTIVRMFLNVFSQAKALQYSRLSNQKIKFVPQGGFDFEIMGDISKFKIDETSHIKSGTYIECSGGVEIGAYFHCGRGLTIFSTNHN